jgi:hypothetical protein
VPELEGISPQSRQPATSPCPEPDEFTPRWNNYPWKCCGPAFQLYELLGVQFHVSLLLCLRPIAVVCTSGAPDRLRPFRGLLKLKTFRISLVLLARNLTSGSSWLSSSSEDEWYFTEGSISSFISSNSSSDSLSLSTSFISFGSSGFDYQVRFWSSIFGIQTKSIRWNLLIIRRWSQTGQ